MNKRAVLANIKDPTLVRQRRDRLIRAAISVIFRKGYHATTVRDIGRQARLTQGSIYNYVRSKGDILYLVCDRGLVAFMMRGLGAKEGGFP